MKRLLRSFLARIARSLGIVEIQSRIDDLSHRVLIHQLGGQSLDQLATQKARDVVEVRIAELWDSVVERDNAIQESLMNASRLHTELVTNEMRTFLESEIAKLKRGVDHIRATNNTKTEIVTVVSSESRNLSKAPVIEDSLYVALEDYFRGDTSVIRQRQMAYIPYVQNVVTSEKPLLDVGCGRGEWLSVLHEAGIPARGIDSNSACIDDCRRLHLDVELADLVEYLDSLPENSLGAVTMFQVMEHLPFNALLNTFRAILRVLKPGGVLIGEVPNSETLRVGASSFWIDPTHQRPLFPGLLKFLANEVGFQEIEGLYSTPLSEEPDVTSLPLNVQEVFLTMFRQINGPGDFALIATA
jgi:2-polyprenyl-3-methyl-5-hydroxy-6-metoxy-1,4-benzoquinol methylase